MFRPGETQLTVIEVLRGGCGDVVDGWLIYRRPMETVQPEIYAYWSQILFFVIVMIQIPYV